MPRFIGRLLLFLAPLILIVGAAVYIDPLDRFPGWQGLEQINADYRRTKIEDYLARKPRDYDTFVFGSSRVMRLRNEFFAEYGYNSFNFGYNMARIEDVYLNLRLVLDENDVPPRLVVLGIEPEMFLPELPLHPQTMRLPELTRYLTADPGLTREPPGDLLTLIAEATRLVFPAIYYNVVEERPGVEFALDPRTGDYLIETPAPEPVKLSATILEFLHGVYSGNDKLDPVRRTYYRRIVELCAERDIELIAFTTANHRLLDDYLNNNTRRLDVFNELIEFAESIDSPRYSFFDFADVGVFGGDPEGFNDIAHIDAVNSRRLVDFLFQAITTNS